MIKTKKIVKRVRYKTGDNNEFTYSDYDILNALNEALAYITQSQSLVNSDFVEKTRFYDVNQYGEISFKFRGVPLPDDYSTLVSVSRDDSYKLHPTESSNIPNETEYKITGDRIYTGCPRFMMVYKSMLEPISNFDEDIELPAFCTELVVKTTVMILNQAKTDISLKVIDDTARSIIPRRRYAGAQMSMQFKV